MLPEPLPVNVSTTNQGKSERSSDEPRVDPERVHSFVKGLFEEDLHAKRVLSLANGVAGVIHAAALSIHAIGRGMAAARGVDSKHATKQVDRLLSNSGLQLRPLLMAWIRFVVGNREDIVVALDWTEFDNDDQSVIALYLVTNHGRATPLVWKSVRKSKLKGKRTAYEDEVLELLHAALPREIDITLVADRGFGDSKLYGYLDDLGWNYVIRFREAILVEHKGEQKSARDWMYPSGRARRIANVRVTTNLQELGAIVVVRDKKMKDAWCLATNMSERSASKIVALYGRRFTIEETFRDTKDIHFGMGLSATHINSPARRERLLLLGAIAHSLLTLLGAAGERCQLDRTLKTNTAKKRSLSLYRQGCFWYDAIPAMRDDRFRLLMENFDAVMREHQLCSEVFGIL